MIEEQKNLYEDLIQGVVCMKRGTKILIYNGTIKNVEDVSIGDLLMDDDSSSRQVLSRVDYMVQEVLNTEKI